MVVGPIQDEHLARVQSSSMLTVSPGLSGLNIRHGHREDRRVYSNQGTEVIPYCRSVEAQPTTHRTEDSGSNTIAIVSQGFLNRNPRLSITFASISVFWEKSPAVCAVESSVFVMSHAPPQKRLFSFFPIDGRGKSQTTHALSEYVVRLSSADKKADRQSQTSCLEVLSILFLFFILEFCHFVTRIYPSFSYLSLARSFVFSTKSAKFPLVLRAASSLASPSLPPSAPKPTPGA